MSDWIKTPANAEELPWQIKIGKRVLWWIIIPPHGEWSEARFAFCGSLREQKYALGCDSRFSVIDKQVGTDSGFSYSVVHAYSEIKGPDF